MEKPIQNAMPKNWLKARCVRELVAKNTPMTGRVVAIPSRIPTARVIHSRFRAGFAAEAKPIGTAERQQEPGVEDKDSGALDPAADDVGAHCVGGRAGDGSEGKEEPLRPFTATAAQQESGGEKHEDGCRDDVHRGQHGVRRKGCVERRHLRRAAVRGTDQLDESAENDRDGDNDAEPEPREEP